MSGSFTQKEVKRRKEIVGTKRDIQEKNNQQVFVSMKHAIWYIHENDPSITTVLDASTQTHGDAWIFSGRARK